MASNRVRALASTLAIACFFLLWLSRSTAQEDRAPNRISKVVDSAKLALDAYETMYQVGQATAEDVYRWSLRLMEAELLANSTNDAPAQNHRDRMLKLHRQVAGAPQGRRGWR